MRKGYIDILKGIGALLVLIGHLIDYNSTLKIWIYSFHMPLFFFISGFLFKMEKSIKNFVKKKFKTLIIPFLIFNFISLLFNLEYINILSFKEILYGLLYINNSVPWNSSLWFLPVLFLTSIMYYLINYFKEKYRIVTVIIIFLLGILICNNNINFIFGIHIIPFSLMFFYIGYLFNKHNIIDKFRKLEFNTYIFLICLVINIYLSFKNGRINMSTNLYGNYIYFLITALSGIITFLYISVIIKKDRILEMFGEYSLYMFCTQRIIFKIFPILIDNFNVIILQRGLGKIPFIMIIYFFVFATITYAKRRVKYS